MTDNEYQTLLDEANNWRYLMTIASQNMGKDQLWQHNKRTTKGDLDAWLIKRFSLDAVTARTISNYSMDNVDYKIGVSIRWVARRLPPKWEDYPELVEYVRETIKCGTLE